MLFRLPHPWLLLLCLLLGACNNAPTPAPDPTAPVSSPTTEVTLLPTATASVPPPASPTSVPPSPVACAVAVHEPFMALWQQAGGAAATCPAESAYTRAGAEELFQHGRMFWVAGPEGNPEGTIYVLYDSGQTGEWARYPDTWTEGQLDRAGLTPPEGLVEPQRGFGKVWREQLGGEASALGWATEFERGGEVTVQPLLDGSLILSFDGAIYHLSQSGTWTTP